jgi:metal-responsive CopG/Arc/MetJ family transcriptional regulator
VDRLLVNTNTEPATLALPSDLLAAVDKVVREGRAQSRDELVENAVRRQLVELWRSALDAEFRHMAADVDYQREVHRILGEFAQAGRETIEELLPEANDRRL